MTKKHKYNTSFDSDYWMESNGCFVGLNMPEARKEDLQCGLPPYYRMRGMLVDEYPSAPSNWMRSSGNMASYFVGIKEDRGMWLDFNKNEENKYHMAVVISIQGVNPITGMPCEDPQLEQYIENCPKCKKKFSANRHCETCGYQWPKQNYLCTTATPSRAFWLDGFKAADGIVRQYILTEEKMRGVANNITGGKQVYAIGLSFFLSKTMKVHPPMRVHPPMIVNPPMIVHPPIKYDWDYDHNYSTLPYGWQNRVSDCWDENEIPTTYNSSSSSGSSSINCSNNSDSRNLGDKKQRKRAGALIEKFHIAPSSLENIDSIEALSLSENQINMKSTYHNGNTQKVITEKQLEVGAGAQIKQAVDDDPESLDFWRDKPEALICINYCIENQADKILTNGRIPLDREAEGFLQGIPVGNIK